ncbi:regulator of telomere elongation helicase 1 homolog [Armigeres subalbatus]|uniref:regulator of telomere elongation helicase 1 homolog n=1 Tax=Armigeres subalbatus TaxID=124917 RepID=UPI002ED22268
MQYNYLLDPMMRKANNLELPKTIIIPHEAHNVEKTCEESASMQIRSTDKACIDNIKYVDYEGDGPLGGYNETKKNFIIDDLELLKEMQLERTGTCIFEIFRAERDESRELMTVRGTMCVPNKYNTEVNFRSADLAVSRGNLRVSAFRTYRKSRKSIAQYLQFPTMRTTTNGRIVSKWPPPRRYKLLKEMMK